MIVAKISKDGDFMPRHVVRPGDTIKSIIKKYNVPLNDLTIANSHLENLERLKPGDVVYVPDYSDGAFSIIKSRSLKPHLLTMIGISQRQIQEHYKLYQGYVSKTNEVRIKLRMADRSDANSTYSNIGALKKSETYAVGGYKLHELYFENLGGGGGTASGAILEAIVRDFGSYDFWEKDFRATGLASGGWAILGYDYDDSRLHNYGQDAHNVGTVIRFEPILVMDVYEHAYFLDYGTNRASYIDAFFRNIDWLVINSRLANLRTS